VEPASAASQADGGVMWKYEGGYEVHHKARLESVSVLALVSLCPRIPTNHIGKSIPKAAPGRQASPGMKYEGSMYT